MFIFSSRGCDVEGYKVKPCCQKEIIKPDMFAAELLQYLFFNKK